MAKLNHNQNDESGQSGADNKPSSSSEGSPQSYIALPLPPAKRLQPDSWFKYCAETERLYPERLTIYLYRLAPYIDRKRTDHDNNIWAGSFLVEAEGGAREAISLEWIVERLPAGSGSYKLLASDPLRPGRGHKDVCYCYVAFEDWEAHPPVLDFRELVLTEPKNERYVQWLRARGTQLPEGDEVATNEVVKELAGLVREATADKKDSGATASAIVEAMKAGASFANSGPNLIDLVTVMEKLRPPVPDPNTAVLPMLQMMQKQMDAAEARFERQMSVFGELISRGATAAAAPPPRDEISEAIVSRFMAKALEASENPAPTGDGWAQYVPVVADAAKSIAHSIGQALSSARPPAGQPAHAMPPADTAMVPAAAEQPARPEQKKEDAMNKDKVEQISQFILPIAESLLSHLENSTGENFAIAFLNWYGRMKFGFLRNLGADEIYRHMWTHPGVRAFGQSKVKEFIAEFLAYDPDQQEG